jgi:imidazole glycerol-phosphate synthase subunit HisH
MITIIDYGICNVNSIKNILKKIGYQSIISNEKSDIEKASYLILPGVGSFDTGMKNLEDSNLIEIIKKRVFVDGKPLLGICLGMQLLTNGSEEGARAGLGWVDAYVHKFPKTELKIPHMGWNYVKPINKNDLMSTSEEWKFYFVHSYYVKCNKDEDIISETEYGIKFCSALKITTSMECSFIPKKVMHLVWIYLKHLFKLMEKLSDHYTA